MASSFCPKCGTPRVGGFQFCSSCKLDFDEIDRAAGATTQIPAANTPPPPRSYSEKYAGTQWAAPLAPTTVEPGDRPSPGGMLTIAGLAGIAVVAGLVVVLVVGGMGKGPTAPAASPALAPATVSPTAAPTPDQVAAAASRFREIENAYVEAYTARHDKLPASGYFASYAQARDYYRNEVKNLELFGSRVEAMALPTGVMPDVRVLLERVSELAALMDKLAATKGETAGWKINEKIMTARTKMNAARVVVGEGLGLSYDPGLALTPTPAPKATTKPATASKGNVVITFSGAWSHKVNGVNNEFSCLYDGPVSGTHKPSFTSFVNSFDTTGEPDSMLDRGSWSIANLKVDGSFRGVELLVGTKLFSTDYGRGSIRTLTSSGRKITFDVRVSDDKEVIRMRGYLVCPPEYPE